MWSLRLICYLYQWFHSVAARHGGGLNKFLYTQVFYPHRGPRLRSCKINGRGHEIMNGGGKSPLQMCDHLPTFLQIIIIITVPIINILGK